jgi:predicted amidohydrolase YtcJ
MGSAQLREVRTKEDLKKVLLDFAAENKTHPWVVGVDSTASSHEAGPDEIPRTSGIHRCVDGHTGWANTKALEMAAF